MKKVFALSAALLLALGTAACGGDEDEEVGAVTPRAEPVSITFWHAMSAATEETLEELTDRFNRSQDEVKVKLVYQGSYEDNLNKLLASFGSGSVPVLIQLPDNHTQIMIDSEKTTAVQQFINREGYDLSDFQEQVIDYYTIGGQLYPMPFSVSNPILYYNKLAFKDAGLDPERPPTTLEEVREYSERLLKRDSAGNVVRSGIALEIKAWYLEQLLAMYGELYANNGNGRDGRATEVVFDSPAGLAIFEWWNDMIRDDLAVNVGRNPDGLQHFLAVASGRAAMTIGTSSALGSIVDILASGEIKGVEPGTGPMPGLAGGRGGTIVGGSALWIISERPDEEQEAAWKYVKYLVEPEQQAEWYRGTGYLAIRKSSYELEAAKDVEARYPEFRVAVEQLFGAPSTRAAQGPLIGPFVQVRDAVAMAAEEMVLGSKDPADALSEAAERATEIIEDYERRLGR